MSRYLVLAALLLRTAQSQAPVYSAASIVNASDYSTGPFAPNSVISLFGLNLSFYTGASADPGMGGTVAGSVGDVSVYVDNYPAPMLYVSNSQINFVIPGTQIPGTVTIQVVRQGVLGPRVTMMLVNGAPALFDQGTGFAIVTHADGTMLTDASPAQPGEIVVIYATGLGGVLPQLPPGQVPGVATSIQWLSTLTVSLNGIALPSTSIQYAGTTPGSLGLYQINLQLPPDAPSDPTLQVTMGAQSAAGTLKIAIQ